MPTKGSSDIAISVTSSHSQSVNSRARPVPENTLDGLDSLGSSSRMSKTLPAPLQVFLESSSALDEGRSKENVTVTVRFRPLSQREIRQGEEIAWYADGDMIVRNEHNPDVAYAYDRVFGPTTTTRHVYDVSAQHVVSSAMEGISGTIFAYGVTTSGKTHTMHGDQRSPGIIPLAVKDTFSIIQETPRREFLLRVSYLEIYNEVVNDLLNPAGHNLRIREDFQGTFVEGIKEEVVLSPAHALSLVAAGEEHRHIGSNNFNLLSSRSHTIFTLTIESSSCGDDDGGEVSFSQLNLIDLAGSESSKAETTGVRRKEGSYINKSLLTLGTVIAKLVDGKSKHIPYRDSKLTRLLQSSLSGQGRVSLICTVTPSSSNSEETHNTLKFAHRAKHIEIQASQNKIIDEKSLIKKYQNEIQTLKEELEQLKRGITSPQKDMGEDDIFLLKQKLEDGHVKLQSRLDQEEEAKAALLGRIQRLTKLILVSTETSQASRFPQHPLSMRRHSFGEEELAYLPHRRRDIISEGENLDFTSPFEGCSENVDYINKEEKRNRKPNLLNWFKLRKREGPHANIACSDGDKFSQTKSHYSPSNHLEENNDEPTQSRIQNYLNIKSDGTDLVDMTELPRVSDDNYSTPEVGTKSTDHIDLLKEHLKILSGEVAFHSSNLRCLTEEASNSSRKDQIELEMKKITNEIEFKNKQILYLEKQIEDSTSIAENKSRNTSISPSYEEILEQLKQKSSEIEVQMANNRILEDQLQQKISECQVLQEAISSLTLESENNTHQFPVEFSSQLESCADVDSLLPRDIKTELILQEQASEIESIRHMMTELTEENRQLEDRNNKLAEESSYAKGLASAAGVELKSLSEEVAKLMNYNENLAAELTALRNSNHRRHNFTNGTKMNKRNNQNVNRERELALENTLLEMRQKETNLKRKVEESKNRETYLENELASLQLLLTKLKKNPRGNDNDMSGF